MSKFMEKLKGIKLVAAVVAVIAIVVLGVILAIQLKGKEPELFVITESSLKEVLELDELSTLEYFYNSVATVNVENSDKVKYHVAYEGTVWMGIHFNEIEIDLEEETKEILITLPNAIVMDVEVNQETMDFIFMKNEYETEEVLTEAYNECLEDLKIKISQETSLYELARENAVASVEALICPWVEQVDEEYTVTIQ